MPNLSPFRSPEHRARFIEKYDAVMAEWPVPYEDRNLSTSFGETHVIVSGAESAPPLVLLHGASATAAMWLHVIEELSATYRCYCVDTISDANKSVARRPIRSIPEYIDWLQQALASLGVERARVAGLSYGGWLTSLLALHAPERVSHAVLLTPAATLSPLPTRFFAKMATSTFLRSPQRFRRSMEWLSTTPDVMADPTVQIIEAGFATSRPFRPGMMKLPTVLSDDELQQLKMPVTVLIGDKDVIYRDGPEATLARAARHIPDVQTRLVPDANHLLTLDATKQVTAEMLAAFD